MTSSVPKEHSHQNFDEETIASAIVSWTEHWHQLDVDAIAALFTTSTTAGLSTEAASAHLNKYGPNVLLEATPRSHIKIFLCNGGRQRQWCA